MSESSSRSVVCICCASDIQQEGHFSISTFGKLQNVEAQIDESSLLHDENIDGPMIFRISMCLDDLHKIIHSGSAAGVDDVEEFRGNVKLHEIDPSAEDHLVMKISSGGG
jgi:hypothetical protein